MTQLFRDDEACNYFFEIMKVTKRENYIDDLVKMSKEAGESKMFGYALYDSGAFPQLSNLSRDFFAANYAAILSAMTSAGVFDSYILLVRQILGESTLIFHEIPNPGHLSLKIVKTESDIKRLATSDEAHLATSDELGILITVPVSDYTIMQLLKTIEALCQPAGIYVDLRTIYPTSIDIAPLNYSASAGKEIQYTALVTYDDGTTDKRVMWDSLDTKIAVIDGNGRAITVNNGVTEIMAYPIGIESFKASTPLHVRSPVSVSISPQITTVFEGTQQQMIATVVFSDGETQTSEDNEDLVFWTTSDGDVAVIFTDGIARFQHPGNVQIGARTQDDGEVQDALDIVVSERLPEIATQPSGGSILQGDTYTTTATFVDEYDLAWTWYQLDGASEIELNSGTGATATLSATLNAVGDFVYFCRATNSYNRSIDTNHITVSVAARFPEIVTQPVGGEVIQYEFYTTTATFVEEYDLAWTWYFLPGDGSEVELNSGTGGSATLEVTPSTVVDQVYFCRATNSFGNSIDTDHITVSVLENTERFGIVVGTGMMGDDVTVGVSNYDEYGSYSSLTWPQLNPEYEQRKWYLIVRHANGSNYQTTISASSGAMWKGWSGITAKFTSDTSSITVSIPYTGSGITGKYYEFVAEAEGSPLYDFFTENLNKTLDVEFGEYTPTSKEIAFAESKALFQLELDEQRKNEQ